VVRVGRTEKCADHDPASPAHFPRGQNSPPRPPPTSCRRSPCEARPTSWQAAGVGAGGERSRWSGARSALTVPCPASAPAPACASRPRRCSTLHFRSAEHEVRLAEGPHRPAQRPVLSEPRALQRLADADSLVSCAYRLALALPTSARWLAGTAISPRTRRAQALARGKPVERWRPS
jgi:hypothetical protein